MADLSRRLEGLLLKDFAKAKAPPGMAKCPACGAVIEPMRTKRIRVHESNPLDHVRCPASGKPWAAFGKGAPARAPASGEAPETKGRQTGRTRRGARPSGRGKGSKRARESS